MQILSTILLLTATSSAFVVQNCRGNFKENHKNNRCHEYDVGTSLKFQSDAGCTITMYSEFGCKGTNYSTKSQNKCIGLPGHKSIKSIMCR
ncbi:hypothetical protein BU23DRAFT_552547 [Bimuria novae-zelandiae CBS 107.79]|uniref:Cyanovirin-N domain-containing protein n=1 Tax=Bimuria novae-zelandiae CBS 107.79 TaxID=1447943 RepID=A0A6A5VJE7_9PLEO|nr:hypothetical protein BU23DRAFT_552547 [Bimuria novae-zelandiae CBS 107.79]